MTEIWIIIPPLLHSAYIQASKAKKILTSVLINGDSSPRDDMKHWKWVLENNFDTRISREPVKTLNCHIWALQLQWIGEICVLFCFELNFAAFNSDLMMLSVTGQITLLLTQNISNHCCYLFNILSGKKKQLRIMFHLQDKLFPLYHSKLASSRSAVYKQVGTLIYWLRKPLRLCQVSSQYKSFCIVLPFFFKTRKQA